jgi:hypothetical protein
LRKETSAFIKHLFEHLEIEVRHALEAAIGHAGEFGHGWLGTEYRTLTTAS